MRPAGTAQAAARGYGSGDNCPQEHNKNIDAKMHRRAGGAWVEVSEAENLELTRNLNIAI
jgi:hypothetical protein